MATWQKLLWLASLLCACYLLLNGVSAAATCDNGDLNDDGICECHSCWTGETCSDPGIAEPMFIDHLVRVDLWDDHRSDEPVYTAAAQDPDGKLCIDGTDCQCSTITYDITSQQGGDSFWINKDTGDIFFSGDLPLRCDVEVTATDGDGNSDSMVLEISTSQLGHPGTRDNGLEYQPHHRQKRAITLPTDVEFNLVKTGTNENVTEIRVGTRIEFKLDVLYPSGPTDMQIELFTPDTSNVVMRLCNVQVVKGDNLAIDGSLDPELDSRNNDDIIDRAVINLGTVTNSGSDLTSNEPSTITVTYDAVMIDNDSTPDNTQYFISAGAEYNSANDIWVGQASVTTYTADDSADFTTSPQLNFSGPSEMILGTASLFTLDIMLPNPVAEIKVDVFAGVNVSDVMSICSGALIEVSDGFKCSMSNLSTYPANMSNDGNTGTFGRVHWDLGKPVNSLAREISDVTTHKLSFSSLIKMHYEPSNADRQFAVGAAVEIGTDKIWAGLLNVMAKVDSSVAIVSPVISMAVDGSNEISQTQHATIKVDLTIPEDTNGRYTLEVEFPFQNGDSVLQYCGIALLESGNNVVCLDSDTFQTELIQTDTTTSKRADKVVIDVGAISNRANAQNVDANKNTVVLAVYVRGTDHPDATVGALFDAKTILKVNDITKSTVDNQLKIIADGTATSIELASTPTFSLKYPDNTANFPRNGVGKLHLTMKTYSNSIYQPMNMEFIMPNNSDTSMVSICSVKLISVGKNIVCLLKDAVSRDFELLSSFDDGHFDRAALSLPYLCNKEIDSSDPEADQFTLELVFRVNDHPQFDNNADTWLSAGVMFAQNVPAKSNLWVGQILMTATAAASTYALKTNPYLTIVKPNSTWPGIPNGYPAKYLVRIKLDSNEQTKLKVVASSAGNALSICGMKVVTTGDAYGCGVTSSTPVLEDKNTTFGIVRKATLDMDVVMNTGSTTLNPAPMFDENTIDVEVTVMMTLDPAIAPDLSTHELEVALLYDTVEQTVTVQETITAVTDTSFLDDIQMSSAMNASGYMVSISQTGQPLDNETLNQISLGESKRVIMRVYVPEDSMSQITVTMMGPVNLPDVMTVEYLGLLSAGDNLPCTMAKQTSDNYTTKINTKTSDIGTLNLGYVCNVGTTKNNDDANMLLVEGVIRLMPTAQVSVGDELVIHVAVKMNDQGIGVFSENLTVADAASYIDIYPENINYPIDLGIHKDDGLTNIEMSIGEVRDINITFVVPSFTSSKVVLDAVTPTNESTSAFMTISSATMTRQGRNLPTMMDIPEYLPSVISSQYNTSQMTKCEVNLGIITNTGQRHHVEDYESDDDSFTVTFRVQMADHKEATDGYIVNLSFGLRVAKFIFITEVPITVKRSGSEEIKFNVSSSVDETNSTLSKVVINSIVNLDNSSTREGENCSVFYYLPPYMSYVDSLMTKPYKEFVNIDTTRPTVVVFELGPLFFTDDIHMVVSFESNSSYLVPPGITGMDSVLKYQLVTDTHDEKDMISDMDYVNFTVTTTQETGSDCVPEELGMKSTSKIKDCQITSSRDTAAGFEAHKGRLSQATAWTPFVHAGKVQEERFLQVYFGNKTKVHSVVLQQDGPAKAKVITIRHSNDGIAWVEDADNQMAVDPSQFEQEVAIPAPRASRYIRVMMTELDAVVNSGAFRFEFKGCHTTNDAPADLCANSAPNPLSDFKSRTFITVSTSVYVCDGIQGNLDIQQKCYFSSDGSSWQELHSSVGSMLGYDSQDQRVYAVSSNGQVYLSSKDGNQWETNVPDDVTKVKGQLTFKSAKVVPLAEDGNLELPDPHATYTDGDYGATSVGLKKNDGGWGTVFKWSQCCP